jgi:hypothetical protein
MLLGVVAVNPHGPVTIEKFSDLEEAIAHHRQPDRMLQGIVVLKEALLGIKRRVEVSELDLSHVLACELRKTSKATQAVKCIATDKEVVTRTIPTDLADRLRVVEETDLRDPIVRGRYPLISAVVVGEQPKMLVRPCQLKAAVIATHAI